MLGLFLTASMPPRIFIFDASYVESLDGFEMDFLFAFLGDTVPPCPVILVRFSGKNVPLGPVKLYLRCPGNKTFRGMKTDLGVLFHQPQERDVLFVVRLSEAGRTKRLIAENSTLHSTQFFFGFSLTAEDGAPTSPVLSRISLTACSPIKAFNFNMISGFKRLICWAQAEFFALT